MKLWWHKVTHWEYWSVNLVYLPTFLLWVIFSIRFRSVHFYRYSNPGMTNGGLYDDSKMDIYNRLPSKLYPKTVLIRKERKEDINALMTVKSLSFPLIVKPDKGCRGVNVQKVYSYTDIETYAQKVKQDFLVQEIIDYPQEIGLFYYRIPSEKKGRISGITLKHFLTVKGNGTSTIIELLKEVPRYALQIKKLQPQINLEEVLAKEEERCLVPFGNHNRGTTFLDGRYWITTKLEDTFATLLDPIEGFYYGRLDIRFRSFEELEKGEHFSIIEWNGAKSEPTHIYDPKHSFWFGQKEIFRHQKIMYRIIKANI
ncbi:D-alanine--D-alanine ligase [Flavobacterium piscinae]|uniref:D-alanine--D-alanine ligase n=1 Tax=Flavobacterium piscinae TaxID=2506424 RepID=A0A4Q1KH86_9FLAO|nr:D-alanine--D-alanine ligase [Flavobacterium piscinae]MBC8882396.1 D-alanine--D-alanine ligase [Flavobacterium piscinae]RXR28872.1 D-alanine--D-alanine ligase [Flavobacterium piscinae]